MVTCNNHRSYCKRLQALLTSQGTAYGFTLTIWGAGALANARYGPLLLRHILLFILGPLLMEALLLLIAYRHRRSPVFLSEIRSNPIGFIDFLSVPLAIGVALLVYFFIHDPLWGIPLGSFLATLTYNLLLATQLLLFTGDKTPG